jgi:hypothetical protein
VKRRASGRCWGSGSLRWLRQELRLRLWLEQRQSQDLRLGLRLLSEGGAHAGMAHLRCHRCPMRGKAWRPVSRKLRLEGHAHPSTAP